MTPKTFNMDSNLNTPHNPACVKCGKRINTAKYWVWTTDFITAVHPDYRSDKCVLAAIGGECKNALPKEFIISAKL